jgi:ribosomal protein S18 acetylase RimI-like enzyme
MDLDVRRAEPNDAATIALLGRITFAETFGYLFQEHPDDLRIYLDSTFAVAKIRRSLELPQNAYWLCSVAGLPVSYAKFKYPSPTRLLDQGDIAQLQKIYVLKEFLGQGIGKPLLQAVLTHADSLQVAIIWLDVLKQNARAIRFYEQQGFTALGDDTYTIGAQTFDFSVMALRRSFNDLDMRMGADAEAGAASIPAVLVSSEDA